MNANTTSNNVTFDMSALMEGEETSETSNCGGDEEDDDDDVSISSITPAIRRSKFSIAMVLLLGFTGGIAFIVLTLRAEQAQQDGHFETRATQLAKDIASTVQEYEVAARSVHNVCRNRKTTRLEFRQFYDYLTSGGLSFGAAQCVPNVTHDERAAYEAEAKAYYEKYYPTTVNYTGFTGFSSTVNETTGEMVITRIPVAEEAPFYFPVHYSEPVVPNAKALGLNTYSHPFQKLEIHLALESHKPVLGARLKVVQENEKNAYSVLIRHPGIPVSDDEEDEFLVTQQHQSNHSSDIPRELGVILVRIPSLLERRAKEQKESIACYLYDITPSNTGGDVVYLGSAQYEATIANGTVNTNAFFPNEEVKYDDVKSLYPSNRLLEVSIPIAHGTWKLVVTPIPFDTSFDVSKGETIFGGVMIFVCTIGLAVFLWRNMRQMQAIHHAKNQAEAERKIIASLYPENVVQRLLEDEKAKQAALKTKAKNRGKKFDGKTHSNNSYGAGSSNGYPMMMTTVTGDMMTTDNPMSMLPRMMRDPAETGTCTDDNSLSMALYGSKPIADLFPETTILFQDLVGFTAWSKSREPTQVFTLLEYLYNAFDMIAKRRRVFKVETVGDCYVAVVGLPNPRKHHAAVMAKFANDCLIKMKSLILELAPALGSDTTNLNLRVGMNSGPVTGGVLRGEKGRFQLFGDSMNTAARMEHHSKPGKILVSPSTAECLIAAGKGGWLTPREDRIHAKGLGEMQTYWVKVNSASVGTGTSHLTLTMTSFHSTQGDRDLSDDDNEAEEENSFADFHDEPKRRVIVPVPVVQDQSLSKAFWSIVDLLGITEEVEV